MENDLTVNNNKSNIMHVSRRKSTNQPEIYYNDTPVAWVDSFRYLGLIISRTNNLTKGLNEICNKQENHKELCIIIANHLTVSLNHIFELFDTLIRPILTYGHIEDEYHFVLICKNF